MSDQAFSRTKARFEVLSGVRAGAVEICDQEYFSVGRHPTCHFQFDPEGDLDVSSRHAAIFMKGSLFVLRDLGSTNGTYVNGQRLVADHLLADLDVIQFGHNGPKVRYTTVTGDAPPYPTYTSTPATRLRPQPSPPHPLPSTRERPTSERPVARRPPGISGGTTTRIRAEVARQTKGFRRLIAALGVLLLVAAGGYLWQRRNAEQRLAEQRRADLAQVDSLIRELGSMSVNVKSMQESLDSAQRETARLRELINLGTNTPQEVNALRRQLQDALTRQQTIASVAALDARAIVRANQDAVALVVVQFADGGSFSGTGFAVRSDASRTLLITNKHVVTGPGNSRAVKLGVVFNGSNQNFRAELVAVHPTEDLALLRAQIRDGVPVIKGMVWQEPPIAAGDPVAIIGFPLGLDLDMGGDWRRVGVSATLHTGSTSRVLPNLLQLDSYGAQGASGSPIFDKEGLVVGVLYGGERESNGRIVYGVPIKFGLELLDIVQ